MIEIFRDGILTSPLQEYKFAFNSLAIFFFFVLLLLLFLRTSLFFNSSPDRANLSRTDHVPHQLNRNALYTYNELRCCFAYHPRVTSWLISFGLIEVGSPMGRVTYYSLFFEWGVDYLWQPRINIG